MKTRLVAAVLFGLIFVSSVGERRVGVEAHIRTTAANSVCLIHGAYVMRLPDGSETFPVEYTGSGFMVRDGWVASCRHVLAPWMDVRADSQRFHRGAVPVFKTLTATFPGHMPHRLDPTTVRYGSTVDVAIARMVPGAPAVEPLRMREDGSEGSGVNAYVLGYALGVPPLVTRAAPPVVAGFPRNASMAEQIAYLARLGSVSPLFFRGVINSSQRHMITTDAAMIFGCSGGPVIGDDGKVIGVGFAILRGFSGMNMVVPIGRVLDLIP